MNCNSFVIFGEDKSRYSALLPLLVRMHHTLYPDGWDMVIHTDRTSDNHYYFNVLRKLEENGMVRIVDASAENVYGETLKCLAMLWRMLPIWTGKYDYVFCRDLDSLLTPRLTKYVYSFIKSGKVVHGINDNVCHNIPLMGGLVGFKSQDFLSSINHVSFKDLLNRAAFSPEKWNEHGADQDFLMRIIWPLVHNNALIHSIDGPNERYTLKNCCPDISTSWISGYLLERGDELTNYMGAASSINSPHGGKVEQRIVYAVSIYDEYGNKDKIDKIRKVEADCGWENNV